MYSDNGKVLICPSCGAATELTPGGVDRLPPHFVMARKIEDIVSACGNPPPNVFCELCTNEVAVSAEIFLLFVCFCLFPAPDIGSDIISCLNPNLFPAFGSVCVLILLAPSDIGDIILLDVLAEAVQLLQGSPPAPAYHVHPCGSHPCGAAEKVPPQRSGGTLD